MPEFSSRTATSETDPEGAQATWATCTPPLGGVVSKAGSGVKQRTCSKRVGRLTDGCRPPETPSSFYQKANRTGRGEEQAQSRKCPSWGGGGGRCDKGWGPPDLHPGLRSAPVPAPGPRLRCPQLLFAFSAEKIPPPRPGHPRGRSRAGGGPQVTASQRGLATPPPGAGAGLAGPQVTASQMETGGKPLPSFPSCSSWCTGASALLQLLGSEARRQPGSWPLLLESWSPPLHQKKGHLWHLSGGLPPRSWPHSEASASP